MIIVNSTLDNTNVIDSNDKCSNSVNNKDNVTEVKDVIKNGILPTKTKINKCNLDTCNTKLKLYDMECRCKHKYCSEHRLPESHSCSFDYKKDKIQLIKVVAEKVIKI